MNAHNNLIDRIFEILRKIILRGGIGPVIPAIIFLLFFFAMPLVVLCAFGFVSIDRGVVDWNSISLDHLTSTIKDTLFWHFWWRSFWVGTVSTIFCLCLGYPVAYIYTLAGRGWQILILVATISPLLTSALVRTYAWMVILGGRRGVVNSILLDLDFIDRPIRFLYSDFSVILGMTQIHLPFMILPLITVLSARDFSLEQASLNLGASRLKTFFKIIVPISLPGYLEWFDGSSRLRNSHLDHMSLVSSIVPSKNGSKSIEKSFFYRTHSVWNSVPLEIRELGSVAVVAFKKPPF